MRFPGLPIFAALVGCGHPADSDTGAPACPEPSEPRVIATGYASGTEGLAAGPDGTLYLVDRAGHVDAIAPDGSKAPLADVASPVGATFWHGALWVAAGADGNDPPAIVEISLSGNVVRHPTPTIGAPNFLAPTPWGTLLVADDFADGIVEWRGEGDVIAFAPDVPSPNGLAITPDGATLYAASTFRQPGLWRIPLDGESPGAATQIVPFAASDTPDGIALGADGSVYVALNLAGKVVRWDGTAITDVATLVNPASLAFGVGDHACELAVTSLFGEDVTVVGAPTAGGALSWAQ